MGENKVTRRQALGAVTVASLGAGGLSDGVNTARAAGCLNEWEAEPPANDGVLDLQLRYSTAIADGRSQAFDCFEQFKTEIAKFETLSLERVGIEAVSPSDLGVGKHEVPFQGLETDTADRQEHGKITAYLLDEDNWESRSQGAAAGRLGHVGDADMNEQNTVHGGVNYTLTSGGDDRVAIFMHECGHHLIPAGCDEYGYSAFDHHVFNWHGETETSTAMAYDDHRCAFADQNRAESRQLSDEFGEFLIELVDFAMENNRLPSWAREYPAVYQPAEQTACVNR